jgi:hypothetical protein
MSKSKAAFQGERDRLDRIWENFTPAQRSAAEAAVAAADAAKIPRKGTGRTGRPKKWSVGAKRDLAARFLAAWHQDAKGLGSFQTKWAVAFVREHYGIHRAEALAILSVVRGQRLIPKSDLEGRPYNARTQRNGKSTVG